MTRRSKTLNKMAQDPACFMNPKDMRKKRIAEGSWVYLESECDKIKVRVKRNEKVNEGSVVMPFHYEKYLVNKLIPLKMDPISREPNMKVVDVDVIKARK